MTTKGRSSSSIHTFFTARFACRLSAAALAAILQSPAFFICCSPTPSSLREYKYRIRLSAPGKETEGALDVFCFYTDGECMLDSYQQIAPGDYLLASGPEPKRIVALSARPGEIYRRAGIGRYNDIMDERFCLEDEVPSSPMLYGETLCGEGLSRVQALSLSPLLCKIRLRSVSCRFNAHVNNVFIINAGAEAYPFAAGNFSPVSWLNLGGLGSDNPCVSSLREWEISPQREYVDLDFFCYPNPSCEGMLTRLVMDVSFEGIRCYYPVDLPGMSPGQYYCVDLTINRAGTPEPDMSATPGIFTITTESETWDVTEPYTQYF